MVKLLENSIGPRVRLPELTRCFREVRNAGLLDLEQVEVGVGNQIPFMKWVRPSAVDTINFSDDDRKVVERLYLPLVERHLDVEGRVQNP